MVQKARLTSNNGFGWTFGDAGTQVVVLAGTSGYGWKDISSTQDYLMQQGYSPEVANDMTFYSDFRDQVYIVSAD